MADDWVSPTGFSDPGSAWFQEERAYDEDTGNYTRNNGAKDNYLELTLVAAISCDKVRILCGAGWGDGWVVDVYYGAAWHNIHTGTLNAGVWLEIAVGSTQSIDKVRFKNPDNNNGRINEFDFNQVAAPSGWTGELGGATIATGYEICGVSQANIAEICGVA